MLARKGVVMITFTAQTANTAPPAANQNMADSVGKKLNDFAAGLAHDVFEPGSKFSQRVLPEVVAGATAGAAFSVITKGKGALIRIPLMVLSAIAGIETARLIMLKPQNANNPQP